MSTANDLLSLNGLFKKVYVDKPVNLVPDGVKAIKEIKFVPQAERIGASYNQSITLGMEQGFSYGGDVGTAFALNGAISGNVLQAEVKGHELMLESVVATAAITRSENKEGAFTQATKHIVENMFLSANKRIEHQIFYGQQGLGTVESISGTTVKVDDAEWASGIWSGSNKMKVEFRDASGAVSHGTASVRRVDGSARTVTFDSLPISLVPTDVMWHDGSYGKEFAGLKRILTNQGTLFGISALDHDLWRGQQFNVGGRLNVEAVKRAVSLAADNGLEEGDISLYCSNPAWDDLFSEQVALREYDQSYDPKEAETGFESITIRTQVGKVRVIASTHVKRGDAFLVKTSDCRRVGSQDISFEDPSRPGEFIYTLPTSSGFGMRMYTDQALFCEAPCHQVYLHGITPGAQS